MQHESVLIREFINLAQEINPQKMWDATLGLGGHSLALAKLIPTLRVYGSDVDPEILRGAQEKIKKVNKESQFFLKEANFSQDPFQNEAPFQVILLDLGISSLHLDYFKRGFSFRKDEILDMRFNPKEGIPLWQWLKKASVFEIAQVLRNFGEEPYAMAIAQEIVATRQKKNLERSSDLREIVEKVYSKKKFKPKRHPAVRTFQAFRIFINQELAHLEKALTFLPERLEKGGRLFVISFHSLEDRLVKKAFRARVIENINDPFRKKNFILGKYREIFPKPIVPSKDEIAQNPRSRSAKMRVLERCL